MNRILRTALHPAAAAGRRALLGRLARPAADSIVYSSGPRPMRLLLFGDGISVGYAVLNHEIGLAGELGRAITNLTGRGTAIDTLTGEDKEVADAPALLRGVDLGRFDAIVASYGSAESATLLPVRAWRRQLEALVAHVALTGPEGLWLFVLSVPVASGLPAAWATRARRRAERLNEVSRSILAGRRHAAFITVEPLGFTQREVTDLGMYGLWAKRIAFQMAGFLDDRLDPAIDGESVDEAARQDALDRLAVLDTPVGEAFAQLVTGARNLFHTTGAAINFIDHARQWTKASVGMPAGELDRDDALCGLTIRHSQLLVIHDTEADPRLDGMARTVGSAVRFYAGYPIEAPDGQRIGALCIVDTVPRSFSESDGTLLRDLALHAQELVWAAAPSAKSAR